MIGIGRLHVGAVLPEWITSWEELKKPVKPDGSPDWATWNAVRQVVHQARNDIVKAALKHTPKITHMFFIDDDITVPPDGLLQLLSHDVPVVTGLCIQRGFPYLPCVFHRGEDNKLVHVTKFCEGLQEIDACGAACLLIRRDVLEAVEATGEKWFDWPASGISEDLAFCERVKKLGYPIALDFAVKCGHLGVIEVNYATFLEAYRDGVTYGSDEIARVSQLVRPYRHAKEALHA